MSLFRDPFFGPLLRGAPWNLGSEHTASASAPVFPIDLHETTKGFVIKADLPGYQKKDINVETHEGGLLVIRAERNSGISAGESESDKDAVVHIRERGSGKVERVLRLPIEGIEDDGVVEASFDNGVLTVKVKKPAEKKPKKRTIEVGKTRL
ncbi:16.9 kDa class I heat shock protein 1 [Hyaloraphidium curvatum]|nr:16.9 kDa class I heat shock protein 1 [Hyaloraphidium curvatum]